MSEIEKLYKNAEIESEYVEGENLMEYSYGTLRYPPFTAKKQLELIKLLSQQCDLCINCFRKWEFVHYDGQRCLQVSGSSFEETLAGLINTLWQDLTDTEKAEIKEILCE